MPGGAARPYKGLRLQGFEGAKHGGLQGFEGAKQQLRRVEKAFGAWKVLPRNSGCLQGFEGAKRQLWRAAGWPRSSKGRLAAL